MNHRNRYFPRLEDQKLDLHRLLCSLRTVLIAVESVMVCLKVDQELISVISLLPRSGSVDPISRFRGVGKGMSF